MLRATLACLALTLVLAPAAARAQATQPEPFAMDWSVDVPVIVATTVIGASWLLNDGLAPAYCAPVCDRSRVPAFDRFAAGRYEPDVRLASDVGVVALLAGGAALLTIDGGVPDLLLGGESVLVSAALTVTAMLAMRRPRPFLYGDDAPLEDREDGGAALSFPSGHTANAFSLAIALFQIQRARHPHESTPYWVLGGTLALATGVGVTRVIAGDHFPSDALAGALIGSAIGWVIPELHRVAPELALIPHERGLALSGSF